MGSWCGLFGTGVAGAAGWMQARESVVDRRKWGKSGVGFSLIPVSYGEEIVGAVVGVAVFDSGLKRFGEGDGRIEMEAVERRVSARAFIAFYRRSIKTVGK